MNDEVENIDRSKLIYFSVNRRISGHVRFSPHSHGSKADSYHTFRSDAKSFTEKITQNHKLKRQKRQLFVISFPLARSRIINVGV